MSIKIILQNELRIMNTFFQKSLKRKWIWKAPNGREKNDIDYVMVTKSDIVKDIKVITKAMLVVTIVY